MHGVNPIKVDNFASLFNCSTVILNDGSFLSLFQKGGVQLDLKVQTR